MTTVEFPSAYVYLEPVSVRFTDSVNELYRSIRYANASGLPPFPDKIDIHTNPPPFHVVFVDGRQMWATSVRTLGVKDDIVGMYIVNEEGEREGEYRFGKYEIRYIRVRVMPFYREEA